MSDWLAHIALALCNVALFYIYLDLCAQHEALLRHIKALEAKLAKDDDLTEQL